MNDLFDSSPAPTAQVHDGRDDERQAQLIALQALAPLRKPVEQKNVDGLALFDQTRSPTLL